MTPALRDAYQKELEAIIEEPLTARKVVPGVVLLVVLVVCTLGIVHNLFFYTPGPLVLVAWTALAVVFAWASYLIVRDLVRGKHSKKSVSSIAGGLTIAAGIATVVALLIGLRAPSDPKSTFDAFYLFVFYVACVSWSLESRIGAAELAAKEQMLRIECRLADLAERLQK
jgi:hypothetical protein